MEGKETTMIKVQVPHGVLSVAAEDKQGWDIVTTTRPVAPYISHGNTVTTAPATITWIASCSGDNAPLVCDNEDHAGLHSEQLLIFDIQLKLGCSFGLDSATGEGTSDATFWMDEYTLWWGTEQYVSTPDTNDGNTNENDDMLSWTGVVEGTESWSAALPLPSPFTYVYSSGACVDPESSEVGMRFGASQLIVGALVDQDAIKNKAEVVSLIEEAQLELFEDIAISQSASIGLLEETVNSAVGTSNNATDNADIATSLAATALVFSLISLGTVMFFGAWMLLKPSSFRKAFASKENDAEAVTKNPANSESDHGCV